MLDFHDPNTQFYFFSAIALFGGVLLAGHIHDNLKKGDKKYFEGRFPLVMGDCLKEQPSTNEPSCTHCGGHNIRPTDVFENKTGFCCSSCNSPLYYIEDR